MKLFFILSICGSVLATTLAAEQNNFSVQLRVYGLRPGDYSNISFQDASGEATALEFKPKSRSAKYEATLQVKDPILEFFRGRPNQDKTIPGPENLLATVQLDPGHRDVLLIFQKNGRARSSPNYSVIAIEDTRQAFPPGRLKILNTTGVEILGSVNGSRFRLPDKQISSSVSLPEESARVSIVAQGASRYHLLYRNTLQVDARSRALLILRPPSREGSFRIGGHLLLDSESAQ